MYVLMYYICIPCLLTACMRKNRLNADNIVPNYIYSIFHYTRPCRVCIYIEKKKKKHRTQSCRAEFNLI